MSVIFINFSLFAETLMAVIAFLGFLLLASEFRIRRDKHLLFAALGLLAWSIAHTATLIGEIGESGERVGLWKDVIGIAEYGYMASAALLSLAVARICADRRHVWAWHVAALVLPAASLVAALVIPKHAPAAFGSIGGGQDLMHFIIDHLGLLSVVVFLLVLGLGVTAKSGAATISDSIRRYARMTAWLLLLSLVLRGLAIQLDLPWFGLVGTLVIIPALLCIVLAAVGTNNPTAMLTLEPMRFFSGRLVYKAAGLNAALFWILAYLLLLATSSFFVRSSLEQRTTGWRRDVHVFSRTYASGAKIFLEETGRLAVTPDLAGILGPEPTALPGEMREFMAGADGSERILRIVSSDGTVLFSSYSADEIGARLTSPLINKALNGRRVAASEYDEAVNRWVLRAAVPFELPSGGFGGVLMATDLEMVMDFQDYLELSPIAATGYGYVTEDGDTPYVSGEPLDALGIEHLRKSLAGRESYAGKFRDGDMAFLDRAYATDGATNGFFYIFVRRAQLERETVRIVATVMLLMHLALFVVISVLLFAIAFVLRPIRELRAAAARVEQGKYDFRIDYAGADEIGDLAAAYNRMSEAITERTDRLRQAVREQQDFLEHAVNDMRNPINVFRWTLEMMRFGDTGKLNRQQMEFLEQMHQMNERLGRMVHNMRDVMRLDRGEFQLKPEFFQIEDLIDEVAGDRAIELRQKNVTLHWQHPKKEMPAARADRSAIKKVLSIFLGNAVKYTPPNGHVEIQVSRSGTGFIAVTVEDSGRGIPADEQPRIFTRFFRSRDAIKEEVEGSGLGLHVAKGIVELHGGRVWFESRENVGTTFGFTIPADIKGK